MHLTDMLSGSHKKGLIAEQQAGLSELIAGEGVTFLKAAIEINHRALEISDQKDMIALERELRTHFKNYMDTIQAHTQAFEDSEDKSLKRGAGGKLRREIDEEIKRLRPLFENFMHRYALTSMHVDRAIGRVRGDVQGLLKEMSYKTGRPDQKIDDPTLMLVKRSYEQKNKIYDKKEKILSKQDVLMQLDEHFAQLSKSLHPVIGFFTSRTHLSRFKGALRHKNFSRAQEIYAYWASFKSLFGLGQRSIDKTKYHARAILDLIENNQEALESGDTITLASNELNLLLVIMQEEEKHIARFLDKYALAAVLRCYRNLLKVRFRMSKMKRLQELVELYTQLLVLQYTPALEEIDIQRARAYVLLPITASLVQDMPALPDLFNKLDVAIEPLEFHVSMAKRYYLN